MNTKKNERFAETDRRIRKAFTKMVLNKKTKQISVREICEATGINRSSFYLHYADIPALLTAIVGEKWAEAIKRIQEEMRGDPNIFSEAYVAATLREAKRDRAFYRAYFEKFGTAELEKGYQTLFEDVLKPYFRLLGIEGEHCMEYHFEFVKTGYFAVMRKWLLYGCPETPEEMARLGGAFVMHGVEMLQ